MSIFETIAPHQSLARPGGGIALRLLGRVLLFSSAVTLILTSFQLYLDYRRDLGTIEGRLNEIERSYLGSIGEGLWQLDEKQLALQLAGILRLPDIRTVEVRETTAGAKPLTVVAGERGSGPRLTREVPLVHNLRGRETVIGHLYVEATLQEMYRNLMNKTLVILASQGAKTFLVSFFILYIFHRLVTRHLVSITDFFKGYDLRGAAQPLALPRRAPREKDELDHMVDTFNAMSGNLQSSYQALRASEQRFRDYTETASDWFWETGPDHRFTYFSEQVRAHGLNPDRMLGRPRIEGRNDRDAEPEKWREHLALLERHEPFRNFEYTYTDGKERRRFFAVSGTPVFDAAGHFTGYRGTTSERTEQREAEERLRQAQKMQAVGQLTGGIAHDFNNLLTVIIGNVEALADDPGASASQRRAIGMIREASDRGAALTHRLLAFSRRQALAPQSVDVNALLGGMQALLRRTLGENVEIEWVRSAGLWRTFIDPNQLESALLNLAINARDAMPEGGKLTIETGNTHLSQDYADNHDEIQPGQYVMVAVTDTGTGMSQDVVARAFEPFFTTKEVGRGTGLGLSMVYGFVKQSGGHVSIYSEVGEGTIVRLYLPRARGAEQQPQSLAESTAAPTGSETILLVEDEDLVREHVAEQLAQLGYTVLLAADGRAALSELQRDRRIDLLFTDVVMPGGVNGRQLAEQAKQLRPGIKVLFTSGYTENAVVHHGRLDPGLRLLSKPYRNIDLARAIRFALAES